ncbi:MAG: FAD-dependent oxidoreductase [Clostridia bacterium]|nr:FAD-dependent oxidoreductase [Clostridia bacterium]
MRELKYPHLFAPIQIGNTYFKNRIFGAPTGMMSLTPQGHLTDDNMAYYGRKAAGGAAVVTLGESIVDTATGRSHDRQIAMDDAHILPTLSRTVDAINRGGAVANLELSHGGMYAGLASIGGEHMESKGKAYGPSDLVMPTGERVYEMPQEMIYHIIESWGKAAAVAKRAGFGLVMVHAGHGWLFNQFLSPKYNHRTDEFGGSLENRARFLSLALDRVRESVGRGFPIELRMNGDDFTEQGMHLDDYKELAVMLEDKVDLFHISCGSHDGEGLFIRTHPSMFLPHGCNVYLAAEIKKVVKKPVACVGALDDPEQCEEIIASGQADIVEIARGLIADPDFPKKAYAGKSEDVTPCLRCFVCLGGNTERNHIRCTVNPVIGHELFTQSLPAPAARRKKVLVAGGGPGGMEAAVTAAARGHQVILCEASDSLGGAVKHAGDVDFKSDLRAFLACMKRRTESCGAEIRLNTRVDRQLVLAEEPDVLVIAIGAEPFLPPIPGIRGPKVLEAPEAEAHPERLGNRIVVLGGGLVGCEVAINLKSRGKEVTIVEMRGGLAREVNDFHRMALEQQLTGIPAYLNTAAASVEPFGLVCTGPKGEHLELKADHIICAAGLRPRWAEVNELVNLTDEYFVVGDCKSPRQITQAMSEAYFAMRDL